MICPHCNRDTDHPKQPVGRPTGKHRAFDHGYIRALKHRGLKNVQIARELGCSKQLVSKVLKESKGAGNGL